MEQSPSDTEYAKRLAERVRDACILEALHAYEGAGISGLCHEGRFEAAISALRMLDLEEIVRRG